MPVRDVTCSTHRIRGEERTARGRLGSRRGLLGCERRPEGHRGRGDYLNRDSCRQRGRSRRRSDRSHGVDARPHRRTARRRPRPATRLRHSGRVAVTRRTQRRILSRDDGEHGRAHRRSLARVHGVSSRRMRHGRVHRGVIAVQPTQRAARRQQKLKQQHARDHGGYAMDEREMTHGFSRNTPIASNCTFCITPCCRVRGTRLSGFLRRAPDETRQRPFSAHRERERGDRNAPLPRLL